MTKQEEKIIENLKKKSQAEARITLRFIEKLQNDNYKLDRENQLYFDRIQDLQKENKEYIDVLNSTEKIMNGQERTKDKLLKENVELQKENEELTNELSKIQCDNRQMEDNSISKDIIRDKIKELEKDIEVHSIYEENWNKIEVLKELLERK